MHRTFLAPGAYVQGPGVLEDADPFERLRGERAYLLGGNTAVATVGSPLTAGLEAVGIEVVAVDDVTACTAETIEDYTARRRGVEADVVVGVGGGVAIDVATAVAMDSDLTYVSVPTIASTDAPCSTVSVVYDADGNSIEARYRDRNPDLVLVDSRAIAEAPVRYLRHGMGDAFATRFEAEASLRADGTSPADARPSYAAVDIARLCYRRLARYGESAIAAAERDAVTPAFERIVEANLLFSGLGFESAGVAGAHGIQVALTNAGVREPHGVLVGFGTIAELVLGDRDPELVDEALSLYCALGLDVTLAEMGLDDDQLPRVGELACDGGMTNEPGTITPDAVADAIATADRRIQQRRSA